MATRCFDNTYNIQYTDASKGVISIPRKALIVDEFDIALVGKDRLEYGQEFDENMLHLLENFAAPEITNSPDGPYPTPDYSSITGNYLENPIEGQTWYNTTQERHFVYNGEHWFPLGTNDDVGGNRGVIAHGLTLPLPVGPVTGNVFDISECSWNVSPFNLPGEVDFMECFTNNAAVVTMRYRLSGNATVFTGYANYQIIGIKDNSNIGNTTPIAPSGTQLPTPTPTPTPTVSPSNNVTPTMTRSVTPTPALTPTVTPTPSVSSGIEFFVAVGTNDAHTSEMIMMGQVTTSSFSIITEATGILPVASGVYGSLATDGYTLFIPYYDRGVSLFTRNGSLFERADLLDNETSDYRTLDCTYHNHPTIGKLLYTLQRTQDFGTDIAKIRTYVINGAGSVSLLSTSTMTLPTESLGVNINSPMSMCIHNNFLVVTHNRRLYAYYHNGTVLNQVATATLDYHVSGVKSDGSFLYLESYYDNFASRGEKMIYTFSGATFTKVFSQAGTGEQGLAVGGSNVFSGVNFEANIEARYWDGTTLTAPISNISSAAPKYGSLFTFSPGTSRLYNPVDNSATLSKVYTWNGSIFIPLMTFNVLPSVTSHKYTAFALMYIANASDYPI